MILVSIIFFWIAAFMIFWANIGYPISILLLDQIFHKKEKCQKNYEPSVTIMIVAHNEEKVIKEKLENVLSLDYPKKKTSILVTSDDSTDKTNKIVKDFIKKHLDRDIRLYEVKQRKGKTNAQNEAAKLVSAEILVMTDANAMLDKKCINELVKSFTKNVAYVSGVLVYTNGNISSTSSTENAYWDLDTRIRQIESNFQTITAGNGALYAVKTKEYHDFDPIMCHDSAMPLYYSLQGKRALSNNRAIAYEKAGENNSDEFKRKVRMSRIVLRFILPSIKILNIFRYKWYTYFYLGHRTARYLLWLNHILLLTTNIVLATTNIIYLISLTVQILIYLLSIMQLILKTKSRILIFISYYTMTIAAQLIGVVRTILRKDKPFWEKAESTR